MRKDILFMLPIALLGIVIFTWLFSKQPAFRREKEALIANPLAGIYDSLRDVKRGGAIIFVKTDSGLVDVYLAGYMQYMDQLKKGDSLHKDAGSGVIEIYRKNASGNYYLDSKLPPIN